MIWYKYFDQQNLTVFSALTIGLFSCRIGNAILMKLTQLFPSGESYFFKQSTIVLSTASISGLNFVGVRGQSFSLTQFSVLGHTNVLHFWQNCDVGLLWTKRASTGGVVKVSNTITWLMTRSVSLTPVRACSKQGTSSWYRFLSVLSMLFYFFRVQILLGLLDADVFCVKALLKDISQRWFCFFCYLRLIPWSKVIEQFFGAKCK